MAGEPRPVGKHTDRQPPCSAREVEGRRCDLVAVTQNASFMKALASPLQFSRTASSRVSHAGACSFVVCHGTILPVFAASEVILVVWRGSVAASRRAGRQVGLLG